MKKKVLKFGPWLVLKKLQVGDTRGDETPGGGGCEASVVLRGVGLVKRSLFYDSTIEKLSECGRYTVEFELCHLK